MPSAKAVRPLAELPPKGCAAALPLGGGRTLLLASHILAALRRIESGSQVEIRFTGEEAERLTAQGPAVWLQLIRRPGQESWAEAAVELVRRASAPAAFWRQCLWLAAAVFLITFALLDYLAGTGLLF